MEREYAAVYPTLYRHHWWWRARERILVAKIASLLSSKPPGTARILDVGCGSGVFFDALARFGRVEGIETDAESVERSGGWRSRIVVGELADHLGALDSFDLVLLLDVIEHVPDPRELVATAARALAPGGALLITVPAYDWLWTKHDVINRHLRRYTAAGLRRDVEAAGLEAAEITYFFQSLVLAKLLTRAAEALTARAPAVPRIPPRPLNAGLQAWLAAEHAVAGWLPFGSSVMAVATLPR